MQYLIRNRLFKKPDTNSRDISIHGNHIFKSLKNHQKTHQHSQKLSNSSEPSKPSYSQTLITTNFQHPQNTVNSLIGWPSREFVSCFLKIAHKPNSFI